MPGLTFNNSNWPYIIRTVRLWALILLVCYPLLGMAAASFLSGLFGNMVFLYITLGITLGGLFIPIYIVARKYA